MRTNTFRGWAFLLVALAGAGVGRAQQVVVTADRADGVYEVGQPIVFKVEVKGGVPAEPINFTLKKGGLTEAGKGTVALKDGVGVIETKLDEPGSVLAEVRVGAGRQRALTGAVAAPRQIKPAAPRPADFDAFWDAKLKELAAVPANPKLEPGDPGSTRPAPTSQNAVPSNSQRETVVNGGKPNIDYWKITLDNIRGTHIQGQLARPKTGDKFPALLIVQWAGVYALQKNWVTDRAAEGWLVLNINPHDLPIDQPAAFYAEQSRGPLRDYASIGNDDREKSYFLRMYLSCYQAAQYLTDRPDWDGKTLVVSGTSQGGMQTLVTAALHPKVTGALALVPAGCDLRGPDAGRAGGWPQWYNAVGGKDPAAVRHAAEYFDTVNFAPKIKCPLLVGLGLIDETCPPAGVLAAVNQAAGPTEVVILPKSNHQGTPGNQQAPYIPHWTAWLAALREGKAPPVQAKAE